MTQDISTKHSDDIKTFSQLSKRRQEFTRGLIRLIAKKEKWDSDVIGLRGEWGEGKTSILNVIEEQIQAASDTSKDLDEELKAIKGDLKNIKVVKFSPWKYASQEAITEAFFDMIADALGKTNPNDGELAREVFENFLPEGNLKSILKYVPLTGIGWLLVGALGFGVYSYHWDSVQSLIQRFVIPNGHIFIWSLLFVIIIGAFSEKPLSLASLFLRWVTVLLCKLRIVHDTPDSVREKLKASLHKKSKILVIIDDIDRLLPEEIRATFTHIRNHVDFPNIMFLVAYQHDMVAQAHNSTDKDDGKNYIEKIIPTVYDLPPIPWSERKNQLDERIQALTNLPLESKELESYSILLIEDTTKKLLSTMRFVHRVIDSMGLTYNALAGNINIGHLLGLEIIRHTDLKAYRSIYNLGGYKNDSQLEFESKSRAQQEAIENIARDVFLNSHSQAPFSAAKDEYFERYFAYTLDPEDLSEAEFDQILSYTQSDTLLDRLLAYRSNTEKLYKIVEKLNERLKQEDIGTDVSKQRVLALFKLGDCIELKNGALYRYAANYFNGIQSVEERKEIFLDVLTQSNAICLPAFFIKANLEADRFHEKFCFLTGTIDQIKPKWQSVFESKSAQEILSLPQHKYLLSLLTDDALSDQVYNNEELRHHLSRLDIGQLKDKFGT